MPTLPIPRRWPWRVPPDPNAPRLRKAWRRTLLWFTILVGPTVTGIVGLLFSNALHAMAGHPAEARANVSPDNLLAMAQFGLIAIPLVLPLTVLASVWTRRIVESTARRAQQPHAKPWDQWVHAHLLLGGAWQGFKAGLGTLALGVIVGALVAGKTGLILLLATPGMLTHTTVACAVWRRVGGRQAWIQTR